MRTISNDQGTVNVIIEHNELMELLNNIARAACIGDEVGDNITAKREGIPSCQGAIPIHRTFR